jgi:hypothetical protein
MKRPAEHGSIKQPWFGPANPWCEFPVSSTHESIKVTRIDDKHFPTLWQREGNGFLTMEFNRFYSEIHDTQVDLLHQDTSVHQPSALSDLLGDSTSMDVDIDSVESELNAYTRVQQVPLDTDPLMWSTTSASPERAVWVS